VPSSYKPNNRQFPPKVFNPMQRPQPPPTFLRRHHTITSSSEDMEGGRDHGHRGLIIYPAPGPVTGRGFDRNFQSGYGGNPNSHLFMVGNMNIGGYGGRGGDGNRWEVMSDEGGSTPQWQGQRSRESDDVYTQPLPIGLPFYPQKPTKPGSFIESRSTKPVSASEKTKPASFSQPTKPLSSPESQLPMPLSETAKSDFIPKMSKSGSFYKPNAPLGNTQGVPLGSTLSPLEDDGNSALQSISTKNKFLGGDLQAGDKEDISGHITNDCVSEGISIESGLKGVDLSCTTTKHQNIEEKDLNQLQNQEGGIMERAKDKDREIKEDLKPAGVRIGTFKDRDTEKSRCTYMYTHMYVCMNMWIYIYVYLSI
jgi:hypothetical protein